MAMKQLDSVMVDYIAGHFGSAMTVSQDKWQTVLLVDCGRLYELMERLRYEEHYQMDYLSNLTGADYPEYVEMVYHLYSFSLNQTVTVKSRLPNNRPEAPSVTALWPGADLQEREVFDLLGVHFTSHPNLTRVLLPEGFEGHPLRKDYKLMPRTRK